jgi:vitamin K-dependent gamma-carboxylase
MSAWDRLLRPIDAAWLVALRVVYGLIMAVSMGRFIAYGWVDRFFVEPSFHFTYWGLGWVGVLPPWGMHALFWVLAALGLMVSLGLCFRAAALLFVLGFSYVQVVDVATYLNHYYLAALLGLLLALSPAGRAGSIDAWLAARRVPAQERGLRASDTVAAGWLYLLRFQVGVVYVYAGLAKLHSDWLITGQPLGIWLSSRLDFPLLGAAFEHPLAPLVFSWAGFLFDSSIVLWLSWSRTRPYAYVLLVLFHALTGVLFPIGMFPVIMTAAALVFFPPDWPRRLAHRLAGRGQKPLRNEPGRVELARERGQPSVLARGAVLLGLSYCLLQAALPLRFALYGGNVRWHEQGMRFSWRVMVREKNGSVTFRVLSQRTGREYQVSPQRYLTPIQQRELTGQPDLIAQLARHVREDFDARGLGPVEVRVDAWSSLNGRRARRLIDPDVDLAAVDAGLAPASWILPAPPEAAPQLRRQQG